MARVTGKSRCGSFRALEMDISSPLRQNAEENCQHCVYFTKRNCGMDVADGIEPAIDIFS